MILSSDTHRPSSVKLWHIPIPPTVLPIPPDWFRRTVPLEAHETSYFADSAKTLSFSNIVSFILPQRKTIQADPKRETRRNYADVEK
jgi:hypothetical protein